MSISFFQLIILFISFLFLFGYSDQVFAIFVKGCQRFKSLWRKKT